MFYLVHHDTRRKYRYAYKDASFLGFEQNICTGCGRTISAMRYPLQEHRLLLEGGNTNPDYLQFCGAGERLFLLSEQAAETLLSNGITGFSGQSTVSICDTQGNPLPDSQRYFSMKISGSVELAFAQMHLKKKKLCPLCGQFSWNRQRMEPLILDMRSWDGADICHISSMPGYYVCSERFASLADQTGLTGFLFFSKSNRYSNNG